MNVNDMGKIEMEKFIRLREMAGLLTWGIPEAVLLEKDAHVIAHYYYMGEMSF